MKKVVVTLAPEQLKELERIRDEDSHIVNGLPPTMTLQNLAAEPEVHVTDEP